MKKCSVLICLLLVMLSFTGCGGSAYSFRNPVDEIERIEIVSAESSFEYTVIKALSEAEKSDFLERFQTIKFNAYYYGDPMSVSGNAIKITYQNGDYEMICYFWAEYVKNGEIYFNRRHCDEAVFHALIDDFTYNS